MQVHAPVTAVGIVVVTTVPHVQIAAQIVAYLYNMYILVGYTDKLLDWY